MYIATTSLITIIYLGLTPFLEFLPFLPFLRTNLTGEDIIYLQSRLIAQSSGVSNDIIEKNLEDQRKIFAVVKTDLLR